MQLISTNYRADSRFVPNQWETALHCNDVSHWLGASLDSAPICVRCSIICDQHSGIFRRSESTALPPVCTELCYHAVSAYRILWVYAGFWWYHGILLVHLQDSVGAFGAKWLTKWLHHAKAPPHRGVLLWEWGNKDVHLVTTFVFCHVSKCYFFQQEFHCENVSAKCRSLVQVTPIELDFEVIFM